MSDTVAKLKEFKELLDSGVLTQAEFDAEKAKVLAGSAPVAPAAQQAIVRGAVPHQSRGDRPHHREVARSEYPNGEVGPVLFGMVALLLFDRSRTRSR